MDFWRSISRLLRRLYVGPPIIMVAIALASLASYLVPLQYQSSALLVLTTPTSGGTLPLDPQEKVGLSNPLLLFNDGLQTTTAILIHSMNTPEMRRSLGVWEDGPTELVVDDGSSDPELLSSVGPFIHIEALSTSSVEARRVVVAAKNSIRTELVARQEALDAPPSTFIEVVDVVRPSYPQVVLTEKLRAGGIVLAGGIVIGFCLAYGIDRIRTTRRARRQAESDDERTLWDQPPSEAPDILATAGMPSRNGSDHAPAIQPAER